MISPSISSTSRSTPCAAGCCGPKLSVKLFTFAGIRALVVAARRPDAAAQGSKDCCASNGCCEPSNAPPPLRTWHTQCGMQLPVFKLRASSGSCGVPAAPHGAAPARGVSKQDVHHIASHLPPASPVRCCAAHGVHSRMIIHGTHAEACGIQRRRQSCHDGSRLEPTARPRWLSARAYCPPAQCLLYSLISPMAWL